MFADRWGRKLCLLISDLFFTAGAIVIASSFSLGQLVAGRLILGVGVGGAAVICPLYITELAPTAVRGRCVGTNGFCIPFGQSVAVAIGAGMQHVKGNWRILFGLGVVPSLRQLALMHKLPESPRVLILRGQDDKAREVLKTIYKFASPEVIELKLRIVKDHIAATTAMQRSTTFGNAPRSYGLTSRTAVQFSPSALSRFLVNSLDTILFSTTLERYSDSWAFPIRLLEA
jgi:SP family myo-inositol transporter-like MFS transporter 13